MDKSNRLGWVPMLWKAYNDAKQALEAKMQEMEKHAPVPIEETRMPVDEPVQSPHVRSLSHVKSRAWTATPKHRHVLKRKRPSRYKKTSKTHALLYSTSSRHHPKNSQSYPRLMPTSYQSMMRELRETRRRLHRIESVHTDRLASIHDELKRMQNKLDRRIREITDVIGHRDSHRS